MADRRSTLKLMMEAIHHYDGYVAQSTGDGIFALFGRAAEAVELIRAGIAACDQTGTHLTDVYQYPVLAEAQALNGAIDDALASAEKAAEINPQELTDLSDAFRVRGEPQLRRD